MAESFFGALKDELIYHTATQESARRAIAEYIEVFYNLIRLHSGHGYRTPHEVATEYQQKQLSPREARKSHRPSRADQINHGIGTKSARE